MSATTIKVYPSTKNVLDALRTPGESYDNVINRLAESRMRVQLRTALKEGYQACATEAKKVLAEWDATAPDVP